MKKLLYYLGYTPSYETKVLNEPVVEGDYWKYDIKIIAKNIRLFGIVIWKIKYDTK